MLLQPTRGDDAALPTDSARWEACIRWRALDEDILNPPAGLRYDLRADKPVARRDALGRGGAWRGSCRAEDGFGLARTGGWCGRSLQEPRCRAGSCCGDLGEELEEVLKVSLACALCSQFRSLPWLNVPLCQHLLLLTAQPSQSATRGRLESPWTLWKGLQTRTPSSFLPSPRAMADEGSYARTSKDAISASGKVRRQLNALLILLHRLSRWRSPLPGRTPATSSPQL